MKPLRSFWVGAVGAGLLGLSGFAVESARAAQPPAVGAVGDPSTVVGPPEGSPLEGAALERRTDEVTSKLRCPVCQGLAVNDSHTATALAMKEQARDLLRAGYSERQVLAYFEDSYGEFVRLEPKPQGFNLLVWIAPALILLGGAALIARRYRRAAAAEPVASPEPPVKSDDADQDPYLKKLREEIRRS